MNSLSNFRQGIQAVTENRTLLRKTRAKTTLAEFREHPFYLPVQRAHSVQRKVSIDRRRAHPRNARRTDGCLVLPPHGFLGTATFRYVALQAALEAQIIGSFDVDLELIEGQKIGIPK